MNGNVHNQDLNHIKTGLEYNIYNNSSIVPDWEWSDGPPYHFEIGLDTDTGETNNHFKECSMHQFIPFAHYSDACCMKFRSPMGCL